MLLWIVIAYLYVMGALTIFAMAAKEHGVATFGMAVRALTWPVVFPVIAIAAIFLAL